MCNCKGTEHIVCRPKWKVILRKEVFVPGSVTLLKGYNMGKALAEGLVIKPHEKHDFHVIGNRKYCHCQHDELIN